MQSSYNSSSTRYVTVFYRTLPYSTSYNILPNSASHILLSSASYILLNSASYILLSSASYILLSSTSYIITLAALAISPTPS